MSLDQKEIPKRLSSDHIDFVVKMMLEKSPLFRILNMSLYSLDVSNGYFTKDDKFKLINVNNNKMFNKYYNVTKYCYMVFQKN